MAFDGADGVLGSWERARAVVQGGTASRSTLNCKVAMWGKDAASDDSGLAVSLAPSGRQATLISGSQ